MVNNFQLVQQDILFTKYIISLKVPFEDTYIYIYFHHEATSLLNRPPNLWIIDGNRSFLSPRPSASNIFRIAHTPRSGADATPLSIPSPSPSPLPSLRVYPIRRATLCRPSLLPSFPHAIHLPNFADQTYVHSSPVLAASYAFERHELFLRRAKLMLSRGSRFAIYY